MMEVSNNSKSFQIFESPQIDMVSVDSICEGGNTLISPNITLGSHHILIIGHLFLRLSGDSILSPNANPNHYIHFKCN